MRKISLIFAVVLMATLLVPLMAMSQGAQFTVISADELKAELDAGHKIFLVDARRRDEYNHGHLPGAVNVPPDRSVSLTRTLPKDKGFPIVFYCRGWG